MTTTDERRTERIEIARELLAALAETLRTGLTKRGHLAQRVSSEGLGYCSWRSESPLCVAHRALVADVDAALGRDDTG